jgi:nucleoside-diphosphate-sugar epimerase
MPKRALVTGASGFVGSNLARRLLKDGHEVHLILRPSHTEWRLADLGRVTKHTVDLADAEGVGRTVQAVRPDWIFHLAAHGAYASQTSFLEMIRTNIVGTINLVEAGLRTGFETFVNTGSSSEYGYKDHAPAETELIEPNSHYGVAKASATLYCQFTAQTHKVRLRTLRLYSVYGPWEEPTRLIPTLILHGMRRRLPKLVDPRVARDYVYVDDVCDAYVLAASCVNGDPSAILNVGTGIQTSLEQIVDVARRLLHVVEEPSWASMPSRQWDTNTWIADNKRAKKDLAWKPRYSLKDGLIETISWFRTNPALAAYYEQRIGPLGGER